MSEAEQTGLTVIKDVLSAIPDPIQNTFIKSLSRLLGGAMAIPAAKFRQIAQGIEDTTTARSNVTAALTKGVVETQSQDPLLMLAAAEILIPDGIRRVSNRIAVAQKAAEHVRNGSTAEANRESVENALPPEDDWMNHFVRFAEDASSDRLQNLFGRILAGQVLRPGTFSLATVRAVSELDQSIANDFVEAWSMDAGGGVDYTTYWRRGEGYSRRRRLFEAGLMADVETARFLPEGVPLLEKLGMWIPVFAGSYEVVLFHEEGYSGHWSFLAFTRVGKEIGALLDKPDHRENLRKAALGLQKDKAKTIWLRNRGEPDELLWSKTPLQQPAP